jgi:hypothetical protein
MIVRDARENLKEFGHKKASKVSAGDQTGPGFSGLEESREFTLWKLVPRVQASCQRRTTTLGTLGGGRFFPQRF